MTLLEEWKSKRSWQLTYPLVPVYLSRRRGKTDLDLRAMIRQEPTFTLDESHPTGLAEFDFVPAEIPGERFDEDIILPETPSQAANVLLDLVKGYFLHTWDSKVFHLVWTSGGRDSRIIAWVLKNLSREMDLGKFVFCCHEPEQDIFKHAMQAIGFTNYIIFNEMRLKQPDHYDVYHLAEHNINAWIGPYHKHIPPGINPSRTCAVSGLFGGEQTDYPVHRGYDYINFGLLNAFAPWPQIGLLEEYGMWSDILTPFASYKYMNYMFHLPPKFFPERIPGMGGDLLRDTMLAVCGDKNNDFYYGHQYNHALSSVMQKQVTQEFRASKFYARFQNSNPNIRNLEPGQDIYHRECLASKYYGLATVYEGL